MWRGHSKSYPLIKRECGGIFKLLNSLKILNRIFVRSKLFEYFAFCMGSTKVWLTESCFLNLLFFFLKIELALQVRLPILNALDSCSLANRWIVLNTRFLCYDWLLRNPIPDKNGMVPFPGEDNLISRRRHRLKALVELSWIYNNQMIISTPLRRGHSTPPVSRV